MFMASCEANKVMEQMWGSAGSCVTRSIEMESLARLIMHHNESNRVLNKDSYAYEVVLLSIRSECVT